MGRKRLDDRQGLPRRTYLRSGTFYYLHPENRWENLGKDLSLAKKRADHYNDPEGLFGTMTWWLDEWVKHLQDRVKVKDLAPRTLADYLDALPTLKAFFGQMQPHDIKPTHVWEYLEIGAKAGRGVRANRERSALSSCLSWMIRTGRTSLAVNPCMRASGVVRNEESPRERYVTDAEMQETLKHAPAQVVLLCMLTYRTLQRPESDIIYWTAAVVKKKGEGRVLHFRQHKTGRLVDIAIDEMLGALLPELSDEVVKLRQPLVHRLDGEGYTYSGLSAMLKRAQAKAREKVPALKAMPSWGFRDLKGKGATDLWLSGVPIERIQLLCGHASKATTEKYIKARWRETAQPNSTKLVG